MRINNVLIRKFRTPSFKMPFWVVVSESVVHAIDIVEDLIDNKVADPKGKRSIDAYTYAFEDHAGVQRVLVFVRPGLKPGRIAHEARHAMNFVLSWCGVRPSYANDEAYSYLLEHFVDKIHDVIKQYLNHNEKKTILHPANTATVVLCDNGPRKGSDHSGSSG